MAKFCFFGRSVKYLSIYLDDLLFWKPHRDMLNIKLRKANGLISKLRHFAPKSILNKFYYSIFESHLRYACQVWAQNFVQEYFNFKNNVSDS